MLYLIDTNICIYLMNQRPFSVIQKFKQKDSGSIALSSITVAELQYGVSKSRFHEKNQQRLDQFLIPFEVLAFEEKATQIYGEIRSFLEKQGTVIGALDLLIAAHALSEERILVTNNDKEFQRVPKLNIENWTT